MSNHLLMDSDFWASRLAAAKRQYILQHHTQSHHLDRSNFDDFEVDEEVRPDFPCPYCYEDFDIASLCSHLEEEHSCESRATVQREMCHWMASSPSISAVSDVWKQVLVCPVCSVKVVKDMLSHITIEHGHLFKLQRRRRLRRVAIPNSQTLSLLARDLREAHLQVLLGVADLEEISKSAVTNVEDSPTRNVGPTNMWKSSYDPSLSYEEREKRMQQAIGIAGFVQDLLLSALLKD